MTQYVIVRRSDGWAWCGENQWISDRRSSNATRFDDLDDASTAALIGCSLDCDSWTIEPVEIPAPGDDAA